MLVSPLVVLRRSQEDVGSTFDLEDVEHGEGRPAYESRRAELEERDFSKNG